MTGNSPVMDDNGHADEKISTDVNQNEEHLKQVFQNCSDLITSRLHSDGEAPPYRLIVYLRTLADENNIGEQIVKPLIKHMQTQTGKKSELWDGELLPVSKKVAATLWAEVIKLILRGYAVVFTEGEEKAICCSVHNNIHRNIEEPTSEPVIRGSREGFVERVSINAGMLRNYIRTPRLKMESFTVGEITETVVSVAYIEGLADAAVIHQMRSKIAAIRIDGVLESGYIEELIKSDPFPIFPQVQVTERPDVVAGGLLEGRAAILVDNTPFVLVAPVTFWTGMQASEDYYMGYPIATFVRWLRLAFMFISVFAPSFFVAVTTYHQEMIPTSLLLSIASAREPVPLPIMIEVLLMEIMFEALREAGVRLPKMIGQTVSILGALVIGQAAVQAGIISAPTVIVVSTTGIASLLLPRFNYANGIRLLRFPIIFLAGSLGLYGIALGFLAILLRLVHLKSFGVPYLSPMAPFSLKGMKDVWVRAPRSSGEGENS
jgi:spore germination protein KA